jgi:hypothetical protein
MTPEQADQLIEELVLTQRVLLEELAFQRALLQALMRGAFRPVHRLMDERATAQIARQTFLAELEARVEILRRWRRETGAPPPPGAPPVPPFPPGPAGG